MIKDFLQKIADKYKVSITYQDITDGFKYNKSAEITGFENTFQDKCRKANLRSEIEESLIINGHKDFKTVSSFNPEKITILWQEAQ